MLLPLFAGGDDRSPGQWPWLFSPVPASTASCLRARTLVERMPRGVCLRASGGGCHPQQAINNNEQVDEKRRRASLIWGGGSWEQRICTEYGVRRTRTWQALGRKGACNNVRGMYGAERRGGL